jgi:hypothetical protein
MTDACIRSDNTSELLRSLQELETQDLSYEMRPSFPILAKQYKEVPPNGTYPLTSNINSSTFVFDVDRTQLLRDMLIRTQYTLSATTSVAEDIHVGLYLFDRIELRTNNKIIMTMTQEYLRARTQQCSEAHQTAIYRRTLPLIQSTELTSSSSASTTSTTYTPIFSSFFENVINSYDLWFYEKLQLVCYVGTNLTSGVNGGGTGGAVTFTSFDPRLWTWRYQLDDKAQDMLRSQNQKPTMPLKMLCYNTYTERFTPTSTTSTICKLNLPYAVFNMYAMLTPITAAGHVAFKAYDTVGLITTVNFSVEGTNLIQTAPHLIADWEAESSGAAQAALVPTAAGVLTWQRAGKRAICVNFGMDTRDRTYNSGAVSFNQINAPILTLTYGTLGATTDYNVSVVYEYWNIVNFDNSNGIVTPQTNT